MSQPGVGLWARNGLYVSARLTADGDLVIEGHDLSCTARPGEYEYALTVPAAEVPRVVTGLAGEPGDDVLALLATHATAVVEAGERAWLRSLGIEPKFWAHLSI